MDKKEKLELATRIMEATLKSPALGNLPGNLDEIILNIRKTFIKSLQEVVAVTKGG